MGQNRIQLDLTDAMRDLLDRLVEETGAASRAEVLRRAVSVYALFIDEKKAGCRLELVATKGKGRREVVLM